MGLLKGKLTATAAIVAMLLSLIVPTLPALAEELAPVYIDVRPVGQTTVFSIDDEVPIEVYLSGDSITSLQALTVELAYDSDVLELQDAAFGGLLPKFKYTSVENYDTPGEAIVGAALKTGGVVAGPGVLVTLTFVAVGEGDATVRLHPVTPNTVDGVDLLDSQGAKLEHAVVSPAELVVDVSTPIVAIDAASLENIYGDSALITGTYTEANIDKITVNGIDAEIGAGTYQATVSGLSIGDNTITVIATDRAGRSGSTTGTLTREEYDWFFNLDEVPSYVKTRSVAVTGTITPGASVSASVDEEPATDLGAFPSGQFSGSFLLNADGSHSIVLTATDSHGSSPIERELRFTVDTQAPELSIVSPDINQWVNSRAVSVSGTVEANCTVTVNGEAATVVGTEFVGTASLTADGEQTITVLATDQAGNTTSLGRTVKVDTVLPTAGVTYVPATLTKDDVVASLGGESETITMLNGQTREHTFASNGTFTFNFQDDAGNAGSAVAEVTWIDKTPPTLDSVNPAENAVVGTLQVVVSGEVSEDDCTVTVDGEFATMTGRNFSATVTYEDKGIKSVVVQATDAAGNVSEEFERTFEIDTSVPAFTISTDPASPVKAGLVTITVTKTSEKDLKAIPVVTVTPAGGTAETVTIVEQSPGIYEGTYQVTGETNNGQATISVTGLDITDLSGSSTATFVVDTVAPTAGVTYVPATLTKGDVVASLGGESETITMLNGQTREHTFASNGTFTFNFQDDAGNAGSAVAEVTWIDKTPPTLDSVNPAENAVVGTLQVVVSGEVSEDDCTVTVDGEFATMTGRNFSATVTYEDKGIKSVVVQATDAAGNVSEEFERTFEIDTSVPAFTISTDPASRVKAGLVTITVTKTSEKDLKAIPVVTVTPAGGTAETVTIVEQSPGIYEGTYEVTDETENGQATISVTGLDVTDLTGSSTATFVVDTVAPTAGVTYVPATLTKDDVVASLGGESETITMLNGQTREHTFASNGTFTFNFQDDAGNAGSAVAEVTWIDKTPPTLDSVNPAENAVVGTLQVVVSGEVSEDDCTVTVDGESATMTGRNFSATVTYEDKGIKSVVVQATDAAGNVSEEFERTFEIDTSVPAFTISTDPASRVKAGLVTITVTKTSEKDLKAVPVVTVTPAGGSADPVTVAEQSPGVYEGTYQVTGETNNGQATISVTGLDITDLSGSSTATFVVDTVAPTAEITYDPEGPTNGTVDAEISFNEEGVTITNNSGEAVHTFSENDTFTFEFVDAAGNIGTAKATVNNIDKVAPTATIQYSATEPTNQDVVATLVPSETVTVTNNSGALAYTFAANGEFTFEFVDAAGNTGTAKATVGNIDKQAPDAPSDLGCSVEYINLANQQSIAVSGGAEAGSTVEVVFTDERQGSVSETAVADENGSFSLTVDASHLEDGTVTVSATATDAVGNTGGASTIALHKDTVPPNKPTEIVLAGGVINLTNRQTVAVAGEAETGARVSVELTNGTGRVAADPVTAGEQGAFSATVDTTVLNDGEVQVKVVAADQYGNSSEAATIVVVKDTVVPNILAVFSPQMNKTLRADQVFAWNAIADSAGTVRYRIKQGNTEIVSATVMTKTGTMFTGSYTVEALGEGELNGEVWMVDEAGNQSASKTFRFNVDSVAPSITSVSHVQGMDIYKANDQLVITIVTDETDAVVTVDIGNYRTGLRATGQGTTYTLSYTVPAGANEAGLQVRAIVKDSAGNQAVATDPIAVSFDSSAPISRAALSGSLNARGYYTDPVDVTFVVNERADVVYQIGQDDEVTIAAEDLSLVDGAYSSPAIPLGEGQYDLSYHAVDKAGNSEAAKTVSGIKVDTVDPIITLDVDEATFSSADHTVTVRGTTEPAATVTLSRLLSGGSGVRLAQVQADQTGIWTATGVKLIDGVNDLAATAEDRAGNASGIATVRFDIRGPIFTISVNDTAQTITVKTDEFVVGATLDYDLNVGGTLQGGFSLTEVTPGREWSADFSEYLAMNGSYDFVIEGEDIFGNLGVGIYTATNVLASQGGTVENDQVLLLIPGGALTGDATISVGTGSENKDALQGNTVTGTASFRPDGTTFTSPVRITMKVDNSITDESQIMVLYWDNDHYVDYTSRIVAGSFDIVNHTVVFETDHFSDYVTTVDLTPPTLSLAAPIAGSFTNANTVVVSGTTDGISVSMSVDGGVPVSQPVTNGAFSLNANLTPNKANDIVVTVADQAGNTTSETLTVNQDSLKPALSVTADQTTAAATADLTVTVNDANQVTLTVGGVPTVLAGGQQQRVFTVSLTEGQNQFSIQAVDQAGNEETTTVTVNKDTNCALTVTSPANGDITASATVDVIGIADRGATVSVDNLSDQEAAFTAVADQNGAYSVQVTLLADNNELVVSAEDSLHNQSNTISLSVERNSDVPVVAIQPVTTPTKSTTVTINGTVSSPTDLVSVTYAAPGGSGVITPEQNGSFSATVSLVEGANTITVVAVNAAGTAQVSTAVVSDNTAPTITVTAPTAGQTISTQTTTVSGSLNEAGTAQISVGGSNHNVTTSGAEHSFSQQVTLARGQNTITITASDALGNSSTETVTVSCTYAPADSGSGTTQPPAQTHDKEIKPTELSKSSKTETSTAGQTVTTTITVTNTLLQAAANNAKTQGQPVVLTLPTVEQANDPQTTADGKPITRLAKLTLSDAQVGTVAGTGLAVQGPNGTLVQLPQALLNAVAAANTGLELAISRVPNEVAQSALGEGDEALFAQEIDTNFSGSTTLRFLAPEGVDVADLKMHVKHSDGTEEDLVPIAVTGADGKTYLEIAVDRFSTFILYMAAKPVEPPVTPTEKTIVLTVGKQGASIDGKAYQMDAAPYVQANTGRTLVPIRFVTEAIGAKVEWLAATKQVRITDGDTVILLTIGSKTATVNGKAVGIDAPATLTNARTFVPLRFISETLGADVVYTAATKSITISR